MKGPGDVGCREIKWNVFEKKNCCHFETGVSVTHIRQERCENILANWKRGCWACKEEVGCKIAEVFETCQTDANVNGGKKLEAKKLGV